MFMLQEMAAAAGCTGVSEGNMLHKLANASFTQRPRDQYVVSP